MEKCFYHPKAAAVTKCIGCKMTVCGSCRDEGERGLCDACVKKRKSLAEPTKDQRTANQAAGARPGNTRSDIVYCFRHQDTRASAACETCSRSYCPACLNSHGICSVCARINKDAQAKVFGVNERGRAILKEQADEAAKKRLGPKEYAVLALIVVGLGVAWKVTHKPVRQADRTIEAMSRNRGSDLSASEAAMLSSLKREKHETLKVPEPDAATAAQTRADMALGQTYGGALQSARKMQTMTQDRAAGIDAGPLEIQSVTPADGAIVGGTANIRAAITGAPSRVTCEVDGTLIGQRRGASPTFAWDTRAAGNGPHGITITAFGAGGSTSTSLSLNVMNR